MQGGIPRLSQSLGSTGNCTRVCCSAAMSRRDLRLMPKALLCIFFPLRPMLDSERPPPPLPPPPLGAKILLSILISVGLAIN